MQRLSEQMMDAWIVFARNGNPATETLLVWPVYMADRQLLRHEAAEAFLMRWWHDPSYHRAHTRAQRRFPAPDLEE